MDVETLMVELGDRAAAELIAENRTVKGMALRRRFRLARWARA